MFKSRKEKGSSKFPLISIALPVLNEEANIVECLVSVFSQNYPQNKIEVFVVDAGSKDKTVELAKKFPVKIINNLEAHPERGKKLALERSTGEFFIYLDADVRLRGKNFFQKMLKPLLEDKKLVASFSRYYSKKSDSWLTRLMTHDPLQRDPIYEFFSVHPKQSIVSKKEGYYLCEFKKDLIPPEGRLLYRVDMLKKSEIYKRRRFMDLDNLAILVSEGRREFAYVPSAGFYHDFLPNMRTLIKKRTRNIEKNYLFQEDKRLFTWFDLNKPKDIFKICIWVLYANLFFPGLVRGIFRALKFRDAVCLTEPFVNFIETNMILFTFAKNIFRKRTVISYTLLSLVLFAATIVFWPILDIYFQQDEWSSFAWILYSGGEGVLALSKTVILDAPRVLARTLFVLLYYAFKFNPVGYNAVSLTVHLLNISAVFLVTKKISKNTFVAFASSAFFAFNSTHLQAITWISASVGSLFSGLLGVLSLCTFYLYEETNNKKHYYLTILFLIMAMGFKELVMSLFVGYPLISYLTSQKKNIKTTLEKYKHMLLFGVLWILIRLRPIVFDSSSSPYISLEGGEGSFLSALATNIITYPIQAIAQVFLDPASLYTLTKDLLGFLGSPLVDNALYVQTTGSGILAFVIGVCLLMFGLFMVRYSGFNKNIKRTLLLGLLFIPLVGVSFVLLPKGTSYVETRNYYLATFGGSMMFGVVVWAISHKVISILKLARSKALLISLLVVALYTFHQTKAINLHIAQFREVWQGRKMVVDEILPGLRKGLSFTQKATHITTAQLEPQCPFSQVLAMFHLFCMLKKVSCHTNS